MRRTRFLLLLSVLLLLWAMQATPAVAQEETLIFLVRHAERADDGGEAQDDPHLSAAGYARAQALAEMLKDAEVTHVYSSDFIRTRETGGPTADAAGLEIIIYNHRALKAFADQLLATPGRHLVVGHSNSTPSLVDALGGDPNGEIGHLEYDRIYMLAVGPDGVETVLLRFGAPFKDSSGDFRQ